MARGVEVYYFTGDRGDPFVPVSKHRFRCGVMLALASSRLLWKATAGGVGGLVALLERGLTTSHKYGRLKG